MRGSLLHVLGQIDDRDGTERALLHTDTASNAEFLLGTSMKGRERA